MGVVLTSPRPTHGSLNWDATIEADLTTLAAAHHNYAGTAAGRGTFTGTLVTGDEWLETDTGNTYRYLGGAWVLWDTGTTWTNYTLAAGFTATGGGQPPPRWLIRQGVLCIQGSVSGTFASGTYYTVTTTANLPPAGYRPAFQIFSGAAGQTGRPAAANAQPDGTIQVVWNNGGTAYSAPTWIGFSLQVPYGS